MSMAHQGHAKHPVRWIRTLQALRRSEDSVGAGCAALWRNRQRVPLAAISTILMGECYMPLSARNQLPGRVSEVRLGEIMAHVTVRVGKNVIESVITRRSAEELGLKKGDAVTVVIKSTEVMLQKD
jgi:molybdopterin-binding protein